MSGASYLFSIQDYLFKVFENQDFILYSLPDFQSPSENSNLALTAPGSTYADLFNRTEVQIVEEIPTSFWEVTSRGEGDFSLNVALDESYEQNERKCPI